MIDYEKIVQECIKHGFSKAATLKVEGLEFKPEVRQMCADNRCGAYGKSWSCPPGCGTIEECSDRAKAYESGVIVEYIGAIEDSFDIEGMEEVAKKYKELFSSMADILREQYKDMLAMGAGSCNICEKCTYPDSPCRFPEKLNPSMEACGLLVSDVCKACDIPYINGVNTVTYIGCFLIKE